MKIYFSNSSLQFITHFFILFIGSLYFLSHMCLFDDHSLRSGHWHILGTLSAEFARATWRGYLKFHNFIVKFSLHPLRKGFPMQWYFYSSLSIKQISIWTHSLIYLFMEAWSLYLSYIYHLSIYLTSIYHLSIYHLSAYYLSIIYPSICLSYIYLSIYFSSIFLSLTHTFLFSTYHPLPPLMRC